ncbi:MAG TPA: type VII secretion integral membrane protein EccD [Rugosimonospora sp.]
MADSPGAGLAKVVIAAPKRRLDLALPEQIPLAMLLPSVLPRADEALADSGLEHGGWTLRRTDGSTLDLGRTLAAQNVRDGEILHLAPRYQEWPELEYDDVAEAIASGARRYGVAWSSAATRVTGLVAGVCVLLGTLAMLLASGPGWAVPATVALVVAACLLAAAVVVSRTLPDAMAGATVGAVSLVYAFAGGLTVLGGRDPLGRLGAPHLLLGSAVLLVFGLLGYLGVAAMVRLFVAGIVAGLLGILAGLVGLTALGTPATAAATVSALALLAPALPLLSIRLGKVPLPALPRTADDLLKQDPTPPAVSTYASVARADEILTGCMLAFTMVNVVCLWLISRGSGVAVPLLIAVVSLVCLLRARIFGTVRHRLPWLVTGLLGLATLLPALSRAELGVRLGAGLLMILAAGATITAGLRYSRRGPSVYLSRVADIADILLVLATIPIACGVLGLYGMVRGLGG